MLRDNMGLGDLAKSVGEIRPARDWLGNDS